MKQALDWVQKNCKFAAFQPPQKGDRIELANRPGEYFLILSKPETGRDQRGQSFWYARAKDSQGREQTLSSDNIGSWKHFSGPNYPWHDEDIAKDKWHKQQEEIAERIEDFESKYVFNDGQPLRTNPGRPLVLMVAPNATGPLAPFAGERVQIKEIDYDNQTVRMEPVAQEFMEFAPAIAAVPAKDVVASTSPATRPEIKMEPVRLPDGQVITAEELMWRTPTLNELARRGQVSLRAQVYQNYSNAKGMTGEDYFIREMSLRGISPEDVQAATEYHLNQTPAKIGPDGKRLNIFGAWQGDVLISPPIGNEARDEIASIAPASKIQARRDGSFLVQSNPLYKQMVGLGVLDSKLRSA